MTDSPPVTRFAIKHLALTASLVLIVLSVTRVYYFTSFNVPAALLVLSVSDRTTILVSTLLSFIVAVSPFVLFIDPLRKWLLQGNEPGASHAAKFRTGLVWLPIAPLVLSTLTVPLIVGYFLGAIVLFIVSRRNARRKMVNPDSRPLELQNSGTLQWIYASTLGVMIVFVLATPWQARESITLASSDAPLVGYVMGEQGGKFLILDDLRKSRWIEGDDIVERNMCRSSTNMWSGAPLSSLLHQGGVECRHASRT